MACFSSLIPAFHGMYDLLKHFSRKMLSDANIPKAKFLNLNGSSKYSEQQNHSDVCSSHIHEALSLQILIRIAWPKLHRKAMHFSFLWHGCCVAMIGIDQDTLATLGRQNSFVANALFITYIRLQVPQESLLTLNFLKVIRYSSLKLLSLNF